MKYVELGFVAERAGPAAPLPPFLGPTLRGALGHLLKGGVCQVEHGECPRCLLQKVCPYPVLFEDGSRDQPPPFVLLSPAPEAQPMPRFELGWGIRLFGNACAFWPYVVRAFGRAAEVGLGSNHVRYRLTRVTDGLNGASLGSPDEGPLDEPTERSLPVHRPALPPRCTLRWEFQTPLKLQRNGRTLVRDISGLDLVRAGRRRFHWALGLAGAADETAASHRAERRFGQSEFVTHHSRFELWKINRYSVSEGRRMTLYGVTGEMLVEGPWGECGPWLNALPLLHIGKSTAFGWGALSVNSSEHADPQRHVDRDLRHSA